jgi:Holliday junction resolvase
LGKLSRDKGARAEREIVALHAEFGIKAEKVPLSGATKYQGGVDVDVYPWGSDGPPLVCEVKARASGTGFKVLERMLGDADVLFLRRDRQKPLVVLPWVTWQRLLKQ